jgi:hypothetical protein
MADLTELQQKQAETARFAAGMAEEKDPERLKQMAEQLQAKCAELGRMALAIEAAMSPPAGTGVETRVALSPEQRKRIAEQTGAAVEVVTLRDTPQRPWSKLMPAIDPAEVEALAAREAAKSRLRAETRARVEAIIRELEKLESPELAETIAGLRRDPTLGL